MSAQPGSLPLTEAQLGIWYAQARDPLSPVFVTGQALFIDGPLDVAALGRSVDRLGQEADALSLRFAETPEGPRQRLAPGAAPKLVLRDAPEYLDAAILAEAQRPMDLSQGPLAGFTLWRIDAKRHVLSIRIHHIAADGQAMVQITQRIAALYAEDLGAAPDEPLAPLARAFDDDARFAAAPARERQRAYWHERLAGLPAVESLSRGEGGAGSGRWFHRSERRLTARTGSALSALSERAGVHWTDALSALAGAFLARHMPQISTGEAEEIVLGIPLQNRMGKVARSICTQVNVLPLRLSVDEDAPLADWVASVGADLSAMRRNGRYRGEALARELGRIGAGRRLWGPLVNILPFDACPTLPDCDTRLKILGAGSVEDLTLCFRGDPQSGLLAQVDANDARYDRDEAEALCTRLAAFLSAALGAGRLAEVATLTPSETTLHLEARAGATQEIPRTTLAELIETRMRRSAEAPALVFGTEHLSYAELDARTAALARRLAGRGIGRGDIVGVALPRSTELLIALIAVLRCGAAYLPLDPEDDSARRAAMIAHAAPKAIFAQGLTFDAIPVLGTDEPGPEAAPIPPVLSDPAYVLFTSGSTGAPKGVVIEHDAIVNRLLWMRETYAIGPGDRILQKTPTTFDVSVWELFLPVLSGATLVVAPPGAHRDPVQLASLICNHDITALHFVPSMLELFLDAPASRGLRIRNVFASGEALPARLAERFHERIKGRLHNLYGPTEAAVDVTFHEALADHGGTSIPIGRPVWNTRTYVLDSRRRPVPDGVPGRLWLAGRQLAWGYLGRADLTADRFVSDPFNAGRMYDSGDVVVSDGQGTLTYIGRADAQVKIRGVRIEPGEVEAALFATGLVSQGAVVAVDGCLLAYAVPRSSVDAAQIRSALASRLPQALLPSHVVTLEALPLTPSGKLDRKALPTPSGDTGGAAARSRQERLLATLFAEILGLDAPAKIDTDFFIAGGDSLGAVRLCLRIEDETGWDPGLGAVLEAPVLGDLAKRLERTHDDGTGPVLRLSSGGLPVFAVHPAGGLCWCYRALAQALPGREVIGLQSPLLHEGEAPKSLGAMARAYMDRAEAIQPDGPLTLLGWSLGGIIAHAMAAEAEARGREIHTLVLLDAYPSDCWRAEPEPDEATALRALLAIAGYDPDAHAELATRPAIMGFLKDRGHPLGHLPVAVQDGVIRSVRATNALVRNHHEPQLRASVVHVTALRDQRGSPRRAALWQPFTGPLRSIELDCHHPDLVAPDTVAKYVQLLRETPEMAVSEVE